MSHDGKHPHPRLLRQFRSLEDLSSEQLDLLSRTLRIHAAPKGRQLMRRGATEAFSFLLLSGDLLLVAEDGDRKLVHAGTESARNPIAQLLPRRYDVVSASPVAYLEIDSQLLEDLRENSQLAKEQSSMLVEQDEYQGDENEPFGLPLDSLLLDRMSRDLETDQLVLPSLPEIAVRLGRALNDNITDAHRIAAMVQTDPAITAKIIKAANSALYAGRQRVDSCAGAVVRLGVNTTHKLVLSFALREVFQARSPALRNQMQVLWRHSTRVAAICYVLARLNHRFNPEHAMLAGLVHDIGALPVLTYADHYPELANDEAQIDQSIQAMRSEIGAMILKRWEFPEDFVVTAREAEDWTRDPAPEPDYCDLVIVAQLHSYVGTERMQTLPHLGEVPCFHKLELGDLTPRMSLKILEKAADQLAHAESLLGI